MRHISWVRRQLSLKPDTHTESGYVDEAGISVKVLAHYPGRSWNRLVFYEPRSQQSHSSPVNYLDEGQNLVLRLMDLLLAYLEGVAEVNSEMDQADRGSIVRKTRDS